MSTDTGFEIPNQVPVMTLRGVVLFPKAMMPLRIFEERYRLMLDDVLDGNRMFAIVAEREDVSPEQEDLELPFEVATVGLIRVSKKHDDGTSFVLLQGIDRVKIVSISKEEPYRVIEVKPWKTKVDEVISPVRERLTYALLRNRELGGEVTDEMLEFLKPLEDDVSFVDLTIYSLCKHTLRKQAMLEVQSLSKRGEMILQDIDRENKRLTLLKEVLGSADDEPPERN